MEVLFVKVWIKRSALSKAINEYFENRNLAKIKSWTIKIRPKVVAKEINIKINILPNGSVGF